MGLLSGLFLANRSDSGSFLVVHTWLSQDGVQRGGFWEVGRTHGLASPLSLYLSQILLVGDNLCCVPLQEDNFNITHAGGYLQAWPRWVVLVGGSPNSFTRSSALGTWGWVLESQDLALKSCLPLTSQGMCRETEKMKI